MPDIANSKGFGARMQSLAIGKNPKRTQKSLAILVGLGCVLILFFKFVVLPVYVVGPSMLPTFRDGQLNLINTLAYFRHEPQRGDVVGIRLSGRDVMYLKRIVGLPGESVAFAGGKLLINGQPLDEPYVKFSNGAWESRSKQLGPEEYYFVGDNRSMPFEDHEKGAAQRNRIVGKVLLGPGSGDSSRHN